jgi:NodT family efflux transporter outer membrane factor (OMF) lipoprotein
MTFKYSLFALAALLGGCALQPPAPKTEPLALPATLDAAPKALQLAPEVAAQPLWRAFAPHEPLQAVVQRTLANNRDLQVAAARLAQARALATAAGTALLPQGGSSVGASRIRSLKDGGGHSTSNVYSAGFDARWEADLWGGIAAGSRAARLSAEQVAAQRDGLALSLAAEAMRLQLESQGLGQRLQLARDTLKVQQQVFGLIGQRVAAGRSTSLDEARAQALLASTEASVPELQRLLCNTQLRLQVLQGALPSSSACELALDPLPQPVPVALGALPSPERLLARRPDVRQLGFSEGIASAQLQQAIANRWPRLAFNGQLGWSAGKLSDLVQSSSLATSLGGSLSWSWLDFGARKAEQTAAEAGLEAAVLQAQAVQLAALEETQGALQGLARIEEQVLAQRRAADAAGKAQAIALARFNAGLSDFLPLLDAERERLSAQDRLIQTEVSRAVGLLAVHKALAGAVE